MLCPQSLHGATTDGMYLFCSDISFSFSELYLDGNKLECEGLIEVLQMVVDRAEQESIERNQVKEDGYEGQDAGSRNFLGIKTGVSTLRGDSATSRKSAPGSRFANIIH